MPTQGRPLGNPIQVSNTIAVNLKMTLKSKKKRFCKKHLPLGTSIQKRCQGKKVRKLGLFYIP